VSVVASLALVGAGCGDDDEPAASATDEWAEGFCGAITTWAESLEQATDELRALSSLSRDGFEQAAEDIRTATGDFADDLQALGTPETESGEEARQAVDDFATTLDEDSADIETAVEGVSGITEIPAAVTDITAALSSMNAAFSSMLKTIREGDAAGELETAFEDADSCVDLGD
jgi:methyl-accepting chemotaxis protein